IRDFHVTGVQTCALPIFSTGIGPDNIDIVINELDALVNIDFETRAVKDQLTQLNIYRFGTSGSLQKDIPVDAILLSSHAIGTDRSEERRVGKECRSGWWL